MNGASPCFDQIIEIQNKLIQLQISNWLHHDIYTFQFWLLLAILFLPWVMWWRLADKKRLMELLVYGLLIQTIVTILDEFGCQLNLWEYPIDIEPLFPRLIPVNFTVLPITYMLLYQYYTEWRPFLKAHILQSVLFSFMAEPLLDFLGIYVQYRWEYFYSFPIYILLAVTAKLLMNKIKAAQSRE